MSWNVYIFKYASPTNGSRYQSINQHSNIFLVREKARVNIKLSFIKKKHKIIQESTFQNISMKILVARLRFHK